MATYEKNFPTEEIMISPLSLETESSRNQYAHRIAM